MLYRYVEEDKWVTRTRPFEMISHAGQTPGGVTKKHPLIRFSIATRLFVGIVVQYCILFCEKAITTKRQAFRLTGNMPNTISEEIDYVKSRSGLRGRTLQDEGDEDYEYWRQRAGWFDDDVSMQEYNTGVYNTYYEADDDAVASGGGGGGGGGVGSNINWGQLFLKAGVTVVAVALAILLYRTITGSRRSSSSKESSPEKKSSSSRKGRSDSSSRRSRSKSTSSRRSSRSKSRSSRRDKTDDSYKLMDDEDDKSKRSSRSGRSGRSRSRSVKRSRSRGSSRSRSRSKQKRSEIKPTEAREIKEVLV